MPLPKELITVTPLSKTLALIVFVALPIIAFLLGIKYQTRLDSYRSIKVIYPTEAPESEQNIFCGGIRGIICPSGYFCQYRGKYPDAGGTCIKIGKDLK